MNMKKVITKEKCEVSKISFKEKPSGSLRLFDGENEVAYLDSLSDEVMYDPRFKIYVLEINKVFPSGFSVEFNLEKEVETEVHWR